MFCRFTLANGKLQVLYSRLDDGSWIPERTRVTSLIDLSSGLLEDMLQVGWDGSAGPAVQLNDYLSNPDGERMPFDSI